jgi:hypothetical protein
MMYPSKNLPPAIDEGKCPKPDELFHGFAFENLAIPEPM